MDWNYKIVRFIFTKFRSLSSRRAWIEIVVSPYAYLLSYCRSPHGERGLKSKYDNHAHRLWLVALLTESVDWNPSPIGLYRRNTSRSPHGERGLKFKSFDENRKDEASLSSRRAWIEIWTLIERNKEITSLSSRRAWIEIWNYWIWCNGAGCVALLTESVDWNWGWLQVDNQGKWSLSSRRAWIEMKILLISRTPSKVALLTESVDWNIRCTWAYEYVPHCRSPHGERGLKSHLYIEHPQKVVSLSSRRAWIEI